MDSNLEAPKYNSITRQHTKTHYGIIYRPCARRARGVTWYVRAPIPLGTFGRSESGGSVVSFLVRHKASRVATPDIDKPQQYGARDPAAHGPRESSTTPPQVLAAWQCRRVLRMSPRPPHVATPFARRPPRPINCTPPFLDRIVLLPLDAPVDAHPQTARSRNMSPNLAQQLKPSPSLEQDRIAAASKRTRRLPRSR